MRSLESRVHTGSTNEGPRSFRGVEMVVAVLLCAASTVLVAETAGPHAQRTSAPLFLDEAQQSGLRFQHFNGMTGKFYFPEMTGQV